MKLSTDADSSTDTKTNRKEKKLGWVNPKLFFDGPTKKWGGGVPKISFQLGVQFFFIYFFCRRKKLGRGVQFYLFIFFWGGGCQKK